ncbi:hypothetical protein GUJ93_ZPchr0009g2227 [Zizania palustris]|uniref:Uncharacterized protein n=1 Tax=Zizania palustris TaxID=103762 RepID=A0A8J5RHK5_ZIZPA|nr:hypothetical protein GUJ93_ZPchr0009g2227 [Zizania palustris]
MVLNELPVHVCLAKFVVFFATLDMQILPRGVSPVQSCLLSLLSSPPLSWSPQLRFLLSSSTPLPHREASWLFFAAEIEWLGA